MILDNKEENMNDESKVEVLEVFFFYVMVDVLYKLIVKDYIFTKTTLFMDLRNIQMKYII